MLVRIVTMDPERHVASWLDVHTAEMSVDSILLWPCGFVLRVEVVSLLLGVLVVLIGGMQVHLDSFLHQARVERLGLVDDALLGILVRTIAAQIAGDKWWLEAQERQVF